jgi:hypothetical protein
MRYFNYHEFDSPDAIGSGEQMMDEVFLEMLDKARHLAGIPFHINSGYRSPDHNRKVGADIHCVDSRSRAYILGGLIDAGFNRIGIASTFIHVDDDPSKDADVVWLYT